MKSYKLEYSDNFKDELSHTLAYISNTLGNPQAADRFLSKVETAILNRLKMPLSFEPIPSKRNHYGVYYRIYVGNYVVYYVVQDDTMKITNLVYGARDTERFL